MQGYHWWHHQHHLVPMLVLMTSHDQKDHVAPHFCHLDIMNVMVSLTMLSASCDVNGVTLPKVMLHLIQSTWLKECDGVIDNAIGTMWCRCQSQLHHMSKKLMLHSISWPKECSSAIHEAICITSCWCWCKWHHMPKTVMLNFIPIILT